MKSIVALILVTVFGLITLHAKADKASLHEGNVLFAKKKYLEAMKAYETQMDSRTSDPTLYYNAGTAALRAQNFVKASLYLERSLKYDPSLKGAQINLQITKNNLGKKYLDAHPTIFGRWWHTARSWLSSNDWLMVFVYMSLSLLILYHYRKRMKSLSYQVFQSIFLIVAIFSLLASYSNFKLAAAENQGIITYEAPILYQDLQMTQQSKIQVIPGQKCEIIKSEEGLTQISLPNGSQSFISSTSVERI